MKDNGIYRFLVGDHLFNIELDESVDRKVLPSSFKNFIIDKPDQADPVLFSVRVIDGLDSLIDFHRDQVTSFDWDGTLCTIYKDRDNYSIDVTRDGELLALMVANPDFSDATIYLGGQMQEKGYLLNNFLMMLYAFASSYFDTLMIHASVVIKDEKGYLFLGKSGTGKSTHSQLWLDHIEGSELLNDDNPVVRIFPDNRVIVYGSPWSGKTPCYKNLSALVGAFVMLEQAPVNKIEKEPYSKAFASILTSCSVFRYHEEQYRNLCDTIIKIVEAVPVYKLLCRPDREAAILSHSVIRSND